MRFLVDAQLPPGLAVQLVRARHAAEHVSELGLGEARDSAIWAQAARTDATIITKDADFAAMTRRDPHGPKVVWIRLGNTSSNVLSSTILSVLPEILAAFAAGEKLIEVR